MLGVSVTQVGGGVLPFDVDVQQSHDRTLLLKGGAWRKNGVWGTVASTGVLCGAGVTTYIEVDVAGTVSSNTTGFTAGKGPLYKVTTDATTITAIEDWRALPTAPLPFIASIADATDAPSVITQLNLLLAALRTAKILAPLP